MHTSMQNTLLQNAHRRTQMATIRTTQLSSGGCAFSQHQDGNLEKEQQLCVTIGVWREIVSSACTILLVVVHTKEDSELKALVILLVDSEVNNVVFDRFKVFLSSGIVFEY